MLIKFFERLNFLKEFNKDLHTVIVNKVHRKGNYIDRNNYNRFYWTFLTFIYIISKPWYIYYKGKVERKYRIKKLKEESKFVL